MDSPELERALRIKTNAVRGGTIENVYLRRITVGEVSEAAVKIDFYYEEGDKGEFLPIVRNINVREMTCAQSRFAVWIRAFHSSPAQAVRIEDCSFAGVAEPNVLENVRDLSLVNVSMKMRGKGSTR